MLQLMDKRMICAEHVDRPITVLDERWLGLPGVNTLAQHRSNRHYGCLSVPAQADDCAHSSSSDV